MELDISATSVRRILKNDLALKPYRKIVEPALSNDQKLKLFSDEKFFDIDGVYNAQNDRVWAIDRADADLKGGIKQKRKYPQKVMI